MRLLRTAPVCLCSVVLLCCTSAESSTPHAHSMAVLAPPDYASFKLPSAGEWFTDPVFGTRIKRLTDGHNVVGFNGERAMFSIDDRHFLIMVKPPKALRLFDGRTGEFIKDLHLGLPDFTIVRWSYDPEMIVYASGKELLGYNVRTAKGRTIAEFPEQLGNEKGRLCGGDGNDFDDRGEWLLLNHGPRMFAYNIRTGEKGLEKDMSGYKVDYATVSASGQYIVSCTLGKGILLWNRDWTSERRLLPNNSHIELAYLNGSEECVIGRIGGAGEGKEWWKRLGVDGGDVMAARCSDGKVFKLLKSDHWLMFMASAVGGSNRRFVVLAIESHGYDPAAKWGRYLGEIVLAPMDRTKRPRRLAHHRCRTHDNSLHTFHDQPEAWINHAGDRLFFRSNMDMHSEYGRHDLFMVELDPSPRSGE